MQVDMRPNEGLAEYVSRLTTEAATVEQRAAALEALTGQLAYACACRARLESLTNQAQRPPKAPSGRRKKRDRGQSGVAPQVSELLSKTRYTMRELKAALPDCAPMVVQSAVASLSSANKVRKDSEGRWYMTDTPAPAAPAEPEPQDETAQLLSLIRQAGGEETEEALARAMGCKPLRIRSLLRRSNVVLEKPGGVWQAV